MTEKDVNFTDKQGRTIVGTLILPDGQGPFPGVIICHGFKGFRKQVFLQEIGHEIASRGLASLLIDLTKNPGESSLEFQEMTISYELEVIDQAVNYFKGLSEINPEKIGLAGHSLGGLETAWYSANNPTIKSLATLSAVYNFDSMWKKVYGEKANIEMNAEGFAIIYSQSLKRDLKINKQFYEDGVAYNMDRVIDNLACPILVVIGTDDDAVTLEHAQHFYDRSQSRVKDLKIIKDSDHNYTHPGNLDEVKAAVGEWFKKTLT